MQRITLLLVATLALAGCGSNENTGIDAAPPQSSSTTTVPTPTTTTSTTPTSTSVAGSTTTTTDSGDIGPRRSNPFPGDGDTAFLTSVEVGPDATIVFEFEDGAVPAFQVGYVDPPIVADPSGMKLDLAGEAYLEVTVNPGAGVDLSGEEARETFEGEDRFTVESVPGIEELAETGDFEGVLSWTIGLSARHSFDVAADAGTLIVTFDSPGDASASLLGVEPDTCSSPDGFSVSYPSDWWASRGSMACEFFAPEPMTIAAGTDMTAPVMTSVASVDFRSAVAASDAREERSRAMTAVDGRSAVRVVSTVREGLYPSGTETTTYFVQLEDRDGADKTLIASTVDISDYDYERNVALLDEMFRTIELDEPGPSGLVAAYQGGGSPFEVHADTTGTQTCLTMEPADAETCLTAPSGNQVAAEIAGDVLVGLAGPEVFLVAVQDGPSFLPVPTGAGVSAWAIPFDGTGFTVLGTDGDSVLIGGRS